MKLSQISSAIFTSTETQGYLQRALSTSTAVESVILLGLIADQSAIINRLNELHAAMKSDGYIPEDQ
jgi:hypothetical protein